MSRRARIAITATLLLTICLLIVYWLTLPPPKPYRLPTPTAAEMEHIAKRMKYHGIQSCIRDAEGFYFIRDGKRCRL